MEPRGSGVEIIVRTIGRYVMFFFLQLGLDKLGKPYYFMLSLTEHNDSDVFLYVQEVVTHFI